MALGEEGRAKVSLEELILSDWPAKKVRPAMINRSWALRAAALAAACILGVLAGNISAPQALVRPDMRLSAELADLLDHTPSGGVRTANGSRVEIALSFQTDAGALCREFRATSGAVAADAVACRGGDGWRMLVQAAVNEGDGYRTASAADPIAAAIEGMGSVSVLTAEEERALISVGWRK